ncbi:hypothetical protein GB937_005010 [Aspergillus fischeri]|nr:hypothetical protein GB937_005010 [Aspergillus fischeri]
MIFSSWTGPYRWPAEGTFTTCEWNAALELSSRRSLRHQNSRKCERWFVRTASRNCPSCAPRVYENFAPGLISSLPNPKTLRLTFSRLGELNLEGLLSSCNGLRSYYSEATNCPFTGYNGSYDRSDHFQLSNAVRYLSRHLPPSITSLHLSGHIADELPRLEESLLGLAHAASSGQSPGLAQVRLDQKEKLHSECIVRAMLAAAGVSFGYDRWPMSKSTLGDGGQSPSPNYLNAYPLPDPDEPGTSHSLRLAQKTSILGSHSLFAGPRSMVPEVTVTAVGSMDSLLINKGEPQFEQNDLDSGFPDPVLLSW